MKDCAPELQSREKDRSCASGIIYQAARLLGVCASRPCVCILLRRSKMFALQPGSWVCFVFYNDPWLGGGRLISNRVIMNRPGSLNTFQGRSSYILSDRLIGKKQAKAHNLQQRRGPQGCCPSSWEFSVVFQCPLSRRSTRQKWEESNWLKDYPWNN